MRNFVDLHCHSTASDGTYPPSELIVLAERRRLAAMALTDHDTIAGLTEAARAAEALAVRFVPGVEISANVAHGMLHVLGLGVGIHSPGLAKALEELLGARAQRNPKMIAKLQALGLKIDMDELLAMAGGAVVGRLHMAKLLQAKGLVPDVRAAFDRFLAKGKAAYVDKERLSPAQAAQALHDAGGVAIVAHPVTLEWDNRSALETAIRHLRHQGFDGIEVYHNLHSIQQTRTFLDLAKQLGMLVSGGSDFHGLNKDDVPIGFPRVPIKAVETLLARIGCSTC